MQYEQVLSDAALRARFLKIFIKAVGYVPPLTDVDTVSKCLHILTAVFTGCRVPDNQIESYLNDNTTTTLWYKERLRTVFLGHPVMTCADDDFEEEFAKFSLQFYFLNCDLTDFNFDEVDNFDDLLSEFNETLFFIEGMQLQQYYSSEHGIIIKLSHLTADAKNVLFDYALLTSDYFTGGHSSVIFGLANLPITSNLRLKITRGGKMSFIGPKDKKI